MSHLPLIAGMALVTFATRYAGFSIGNRRSPAWERFVELVPVATFAAIVAASVAGERGEGLVRVGAAAAAAVATWYSRRAWVGIIAGLLAFALAR